MNNSTELNELFSALSLFQGELENATKEIGKPGITYKYADLAICLNTAKAHLLKNNLAVTQLLGMSQNGKQTMITMLTHKSGQYISSETELPAAILHGSSGKNPVQVLGSAITYMRRYSFAAIIGMAQEDDDGNSSNNTTANVKKQTNQTNQVTSKNDDNKPWYTDELYEQHLKLITEKINSGHTPYQVVTEIRLNFKVANKYSDLIDKI